MQTHFFPSRTMAFYMARLFLVRTFAVLAALVLVLQALDLLGESDKILAVAGNDNGDLWRYVSMRTPQIIQRFLPFSVLLGTLITMITLNQNSEVISMKASGRSKLWTGTVCTVGWCAPKTSARTAAASA